MDVETLAQIALFADLEREELHCSIHGESQFFKAGETVFREGDPVKGFLVILEGTLQVYRMIRGQRVVISDFTTGMTGGEVPLLSGTPHLAHGQALTDLRLFTMDAAAFWKMMGECSVVRERILRNMTERNAELQMMSFQREKLVSLGTMAAGLAHELNNPASAAKRSAQELAEGLEVFNRRASAILQRYIFRESVDEDYAFDAIQKQVLKGAKGLSLLEKSEREDEILDWLDELDIEDADEIAPVLAQSGFTVDALSEMADRLIVSEVGSFVRWVSKEIELRDLASELVESTTRMSDLVRAMKSYSFMDKDGEAGPVNVREGLDNTITIMGHKARGKNIHFEREYDPDLPPILANGGELNQVWTNILDNAIDASESGGEIIVRARPLSDRQCVEIQIEDHGAGIPEDIQCRIFDPFFTTKDVGEGTGLGLEITYRIVTRHGGRIDVESRPGRTVFRTTLPIENKPGAKASAERSTTASA